MQPNATLEFPSSAERNEESMSQLSVQRVDGEFLVRVDRPLWVKLFYRNCHLYRHRLTGQLVLLTAQEEQDLICLLYTSPSPRD